jgi:hypothetical protein
MLPVQVPVTSAAKAVAALNAIIKAAQRHKSCFIDITSW